MRFSERKLFALLGKRTDQCKGNNYTVANDKYYWSNRACKRIVPGCLILRWIIRDSCSHQNVTKDDGCQPNTEKNEVLFSVWEFNTTFLLSVMPLICFAMNLCDVLRDLVRIYNRMLAYHNI